ncbi:hypothetical protein BXY70_1542 [Roseovarius halotolerans]|uniref:Uncharacterized protein n=1 Tax=Roseovarius halotolerans TaxID=505353 RepID=A0A1X6Z550_9RHOB|nr:hypothetical protein BXY70_1542 [Roseovarius halotolerans]SLN40439.1 hypothetical protein ROH8110_02163 [Roseovarius halotolerans]
MIKNLKNSFLGRRIHRLSRDPLFGAPLRALARLLRHDGANPAYWSRANRHHNRAQRAALARFEADTGNQS